MENSFVSLIDSAASVLVVLPTKPYFDQVAAGLSLYLAISDKKEAAVYCPSPITVGMNRLVGITKISEELGKKNLTIKFAGYEATNIDKVSYDIDGGEFKLTVTPKAGFNSPTENQVAVSYSGVSADLIILVGGANDSHFPILESTELKNAKVIHIGTRVLDSKREVLSFAKPGATTSELVVSLIKENGLTLDADTAANLVMGIEEGSSNFGSPEVTPETFETFAYLLRNGGRRMPRVKLSPTSFPPGAIPTKPYGEKVQKEEQVQQVIQSTQPKQSATPITNPEPVAEQIEAKEEMVENPPEDWLQPKIFKGTNVS
jgi:hypothetical protein